MSKYLMSQKEYQHMDINTPAWENANSENRNIKQKNNHDNNVYNRSVILDPLNVFNVDKNSLNRVCSTENDVGKKSDVDNNSTVLSCNLNSEKSVFRSKIIPNCISSSILTGNERNKNLMPSSIMSTSPFNSDNNLPVDEVTNHPLFQAYSEPSLFTTSFQQISSTDVTFIPTVVSSSLSPPSSLQNSSGTSQCHWNITNPNTEEQLQILLKLHNLFGLSIFDKSNLTSMNSISLKGEDSTFNNQLFLNNIISNSKTSLSDQNQSNLSLNFNSETISPINSSSYMMSIMMNALINKELLEHLHPLSPFQHEALSHHQHRKLMQQQQKLHYQQSPEIVPQLTVSDQNQILANILTSRLFLDNNGEKNIFQDFNEVVKLNNTNLSLSCYGKLVDDLLYCNTN
ncbi:unnamed protein product [Heterobilharzia americana]|nr:unnamed protein product [Heterobilharzia americana]